MRHIHFSDVGVIVNSIEEVDEIYLTYSALDVPIENTFEENREKAQHNLLGWFVQCTIGNISTTVVDRDVLAISLIEYPIKYSMGSLDFAIACQLLMSNQEDELIAYLDKYCKEYV